MREVHKHYHVRVIVRKGATGFLGCANSYTHEHVLLPASIARPPSEPHCFRVRRVARTFGTGPNTPARLAATQWAGIQHGGLWRHADHRWGVLFCRLLGAVAFRGVQCCYRRAASMGAVHLRYELACQSPTGGGRHVVRRWSLRPHHRAGALDREQQHRGIRPEHGWDLSLIHISEPTRPY